MRSADPLHSCTRATAAASRTHVSWCVSLSHALLGTRLRNSTSTTTLTEVLSRTHRSTNVTVRDPPRTREAAQLCSLVRWCTPWHAGMLSLPDGYYVVHSWHHRSPARQHAIGTTAPNDTLPDSQAEGGRQTGERAARRAVRWLSVGHHPRRQLRQARRRRGGTSARQGAPCWWWCKSVELAAAARTRSGWAPG